MVQNLVKMHIFRCTMTSWHDQQRKKKRKRQTDSMVQHSRTLQAERVKFCHKVHNNKLKISRLEELLEIRGKAVQGWIHKVLRQHHNEWVESYQTFSNISNSRRSWVSSQSTRTSRRWMRWWSSSIRGKIKSCSSRRRKRISLIGSHRPQSSWGAKELKTSWTRKLVRQSKTLWRRSSERSSPRERRAGRRN